MRTYHAQATITATADNTTSIQIIRDCYLWLIQFRLILTNATLANADYCYGQISLVPFFQSASDAPNILTVFGSAVAFTTSGAAVQNTNSAIPMKYPLKAGEKVAVSVIESGSNTWNFAMVLHTSA